MPQGAWPLAHRDAVLEQEGANLVDYGGALANEPAADAMECLKIELLVALEGYKAHSRALHRLGDCLSIAIVILVTFAIRPHVVGRHQPGVMAKRLKFATEMMRPGAGLHADEARPLASLACWKSWSTAGPSHSRT